MTLIGIKFKEDGKTYNFTSETEFVEGTKVIVDTERGEQLGVVAKSNVGTVKKDENMKPILREATDADYEKYLKNIKDAKFTLSNAKKIVEKLGLNMNLIDATYSLDKKILFFNFISDERIDFRNLVKELASKYRARIELHQLGVRDKAKKVGGLGLCGRVLCCHGHLNNINSVNINMVKTQDIALNPTKINGVCGRLLCCFNYENSLYEENRKKLPKIGEIIKKNNKTGTVVKLDILNLKYTIKYDENELEEVSIND